MEKHQQNPLKKKIYEIIFEADTPAGKYFDIILFVAIFASVVVVALETVNKFASQHLSLLVMLEWSFTIFFSLEYIARLYCTQRPLKYALSFYGLIDLISIIPTYAGLFFAGSQSLMFVRSLRLLRVFRVFKLVGFLNESAVIVQALKSSRAKITIFMFFITIVISIFGSIMYLIEGSVNESFDSIPRSIYWAIVTLTTVGYGDISPVTPMGQLLSSVIMILGYAVIAVPTGIVSSEMIKGITAKNISTQVCPNCLAEGHSTDAHYCMYCGHQLNG
jgi:voltage-gated potassium channel